jgi:signal transduction histidine kinase/CheY-like chemotaxis protein/HPt (histidine-containing phosphotransfer) domain-containing protein
MVRLPDGVIKPGAPVSDAIRAHAERGDYGSGDIGELVQKRLVNLADGDFVQAELRLSGGTTLDLRKAPLAEGGAVVISSDITERKKAEEELIAAKDEAEAATRAKDTFLATMSHEIRTPMNGVVGMIDLLRQTKLDGDQRQMMTTVRDSAYALLTIINDILDFSKIEAGKLDLEQIPVSIRDVVEGVGETLAPNSRAKGIRLLTYIDPNIPDAVLGDQVRLRQILFNIAGNAVKFTVEGKVTVRADLMPSGDDKSATVRFQVIDTGIGIPEEAQKNLFKEFSQAEASTTRRFGGTGLGLSICQRLTELMGGSITVASEPGEGSTFAVTVSLPVGPDDAIKSDGHDLSGVRVLAVLRDESARDQLSPYIAHWGADVVAEADIERAETLVTQAQAEGKAFQIVVLSSAWTLEQQEAVIQSIRGNADHSDIRFLLMSSSRTKADRKEIENTVYVDTDPLRRAPFIRAVAVAAGRASPEVTYDEDDLDLLRGEAVTVDEAAARGQLILVAEDNLTNQDVILRQLGLLGYAADMADDGQEALDALAEKSYAVLLTDCHMPNVDGFELTQTIRRNEEGGDTHLPVIAITASALEAEIERCFESGMDDFLAKPLEMNKLKEMLRKWMPSAAPSDVSEEVPTGPAAPDQAQAEDGDGGDGPIDPSALKSVFGDDEETFKEILNDFVAPATDNVAEIETAFANRSAKDVGAAAHKLKSSARAVGAHRLAELCLALEEAGKSENWADIEASAPQLQDVLGNVVEYIESL